MKLNEIRDNDGAHKGRMRVGRGIGSGKGKTCGRGGKGQTARTGVAINGFEGGQMPIYRRLPKRGFNNIFRREYVVINLDDLQRFVDAGRIDPSAPVTAASLASSGVISHPRDGVRLLANGALTASLTIEVAGASQAAMAAVVKAGGTITVIEPAKPAPASAS
ncbi:MAG: 50S ribosomal protein L15 [Alphaproteobacteria bacterium]|nr:50S ribosomal protein L15 [Alphaproteobacteria bacterium]